MISAKNLNALETSTKLQNRYSNGDIAFLEDEKRKMRFHAQWEPMDEEENVLTTNLYTLNKAALAKIPCLHTTEEFEECKKVVASYLTKHLSSNVFLLLCKDLDYYTILNKAAYTVIQPNFLTLGDAVVECAKDLGKVLSIEYNDLDDVVEVWVKSNDEIYCALLFPANQFMVTYGK